MLKAMRHQLEIMLVGHDYCTASQCCTEKEMGESENWRTYLGRSGERNLESVINGPSSGPSCATVSLSLRTFIFQEFELSIILPLR